MRGTLTGSALRLVFGCDGENEPAGGPGGGGAKTGVAKGMGYGTGYCSELAPELKTPAGVSTKSLTETKVAKWASVEVTGAGGPGGGIEVGEGPGSSGDEWATSAGAGTGEEGLTRGARACSACLAFFAFFSLFASFASSASRRRCSAIRAISLSWSIPATHPIMVKRVFPSGLHLTNFLPSSQDMALDGGAEALGAALVERRYVGCRRATDGRGW